MSAEPSPALNPSFNGVQLGDVANKVKETRRVGQCDGRGRTLTECTLFDSAGIAYGITDGYVVRIEAGRGVAANAALPFGSKIGGGFADTLRRSFPKIGGKAFVMPGKSGVTVVRMIQEPDTEYEFELQLQFDVYGKLESIVYKDVL